MPREDSNYTRKEVSYDHINPPAGGFFVYMLRAYEIICKMQVFFLHVNETLNY